MQQDKIKSELSYKSILDNTLQGFILVNDFFEIVSFNHLAQEYCFSLTDENLEIQASLLKFFPSEKLRNFYKATTKALSGETNSLELKLTDTQGKERYFHFNFIPIKKDSKDSSSSLISISFVDYTKQRLAEINRDRFLHLLEYTNELASVGGWEFNIKTEELLLTKQVYEILNIKEENPLTLEEALNLFSKKNREKIAKSIEKSIANHQEFRLNLKITLPKKNEIWIRLTCKPIIKDGLATKLVGSIADITGFKKRQQKLQRQKRELQNLANSLPHWVWIMDKTGKITYLNKPMKQQFPKIKPDAINRVREVVSEDDKKKFVKELEYSLDAIRNFSLEHKVKSNFKNIWVSTKIVPFVSENEILWLGSMTDIDQKKKIEDSKDEFLALASHELKTPLTTIKSYIDLMSSKVKEFEERKFARYINRSQKGVLKLEALINELLDLNRITVGQLMLNKQMVKTDEIVNQVYQNAKKRFTDADIQLKLNCPIETKLDKSRIEQVLSNLVSNAYKYSLEKPNIIISTDHDKEYVHISVEDQGFGIRKKDIPKLFKRFYRVEDTASKVSGLGIGLYLSKKIIDMHKGELIIESEYKKGSTFTVKIPIV